mmetsp:Transcript_14316/g.34709  ORF Transcript_14316/g.34709 Transcript_14316/m.34709 type:complete len:267 (+) Transcript_14316:169-969(+)|eukprot:CAMPEP_0113631294 /NCGR_PEP_ID=MMETSP0017_2-20120614/16262_1 /TAXON_ID=2856 /ORGANISM="Cylindrotheca closterium" /LENGTH=266 /DNA_ID=CAMNT_0000541797 /DNA_START=101 /DNA_END=901 /DNA_ORIENTATION=- /assembly_acc=CAM_ASM_000147
MFDISWGELVVLGSVGAALAGRRDLPGACRYVGLQVGRVVGLLQGARARADRFSAQNELRQLQNELRSGLRELDQVKTELVVAASMGRTLGATTPSANRLVSNNTNLASYRMAQPTISPQTMAGDFSSGNVSVSTNESSTPQPERASVNHGKPNINDLIESLPLSPIIQSERASMEEEWEKQGISFRSTAEQGFWMNNGSLRAASNGEASTGSEILENLIQQNLVFDQYNRVVANQEHELQQRIKAIKAKGNGDENTGRTNRREGK